MRPGRSLKKLAIAATAHLLGLLALPWFRRASSDAPRSILVVRVDERVGNVLLTTPLLSRLRASFTAAEIAVLVAASKVPLLEPGFQVIPFEKRWFFRDPLRFWRLIGGLRRARYDVVIDASHWHSFSLSSALLSASTLAPIRIAHDRGPTSRLASVRVPAPSGEEPETRTKQRLLEPLGLSPEGVPMSTALGRSEAAQALVHRALGGQRALILAPGARKPDHRAPVELFRRAARLARARGELAAVIWGPGEERLAEAVATGTEAMVLPPTNLEEMAAFFRAATAVLANDTGPMHLAVACAAPTIALFTMEDASRWGHSEPPHAIVRGAAGPLEEVWARVEREVLARLTSKTARV
ncbi:MAG: glycosyltransferase family 9 protein [Myxococcota bacterium]